MKRNILWVDDEIDLLKAHIIFLEKKGYMLTPMNNGADAIAMIEKETYDAVLLDEMMPGMDGLSVLEEIKNIDPGLPVVMITKSEEEHIMDDALGARISDYLIKPVNPGQIFTTLKRLLDSAHLRGERVSREYTRQTSLNRMELLSGLDCDGWMRIYNRLAGWDLEIDEFNDAGLRQIHMDQKKEFRREFSKYVEKEYRTWIAGDGPVMSHNIIDHHVKPLLKNGDKVYLLVIDCLRHDHWLAIEQKLEQLFVIERDLYYSLLPTATPFSRNALFAGMLPKDIAKIHPDIFENAGHDGYSMNRYEHELLDMNLARSGIRLNRPTVYEKVLTTEDAQGCFKRLKTYKDNKLITIAYNFIDLLSHQRSENDILMEIAPDEGAFRSLTTAWFDHSVLLEILKFIAAEEAKLVITTDHGSLLVERPTSVRGDRSTSTNIRYKYGKNLKCEPSEVMKVSDPEVCGLPSLGPGTDYLFAKEEFYLVYQNNYRQYEKLYMNTFQHGGISMEEMILPIGIGTPR